MEISYLIIISAAVTAASLTGVASLSTMETECTDFIKKKWQVDQVTHYMFKPPDNNLNTVNQTDLSIVAFRL